MPSDTLLCKLPNASHRNAVAAFFIITLYHEFLSAIFPALSRSYSLCPSQHMRHLSHNCSTCCVPDL